MRADGKDGRDGEHGKAQEGGAAETGREEFPEGTSVLGEVVVVSVEQLSRLPCLAGLTLAHFPLFALGQTVPLFILWADMRLETGSDNAVTLGFPAGILR